MSKVKWVSRQFARFDLALIKISRPLVAINTLSNLTVAVIASVFVFGIFASVGFVGIAILGYFFHKSGFFMETVNEAFEQQSKILWHRQQRWLAARIVKCERMSEKELNDELAEVERELRL